MNSATCVGTSAGNLFFQLVNARYERGANRGFAEWGECSATRRFHDASPLNRLVLRTRPLRASGGPPPDTGELSSSIQPRSHSVDDSQLVQNCANVTASTAFQGASFVRTVQAAVDRIKQKA